MEKTEQLSDELKSRIDRIKNNLPEFTWREINLQGLIYELTAEDIQPAKYPRIYQVETTILCNLKCKFCPRTFDRLGTSRYHPERTNPRSMDYELFVSILNRMPWVQSIELFHFGEPFMHDDFFRFVELCSHRQIYTVAASNLTMPSFRDIERVFSAGLDFLVVDVDTLDPAEYRKIRPGNGIRAQDAIYFNTLKRNLLFVLLHQRNQRPYTVVQAIMLAGKPPYTPSEFKDWLGGKHYQPDELRFKFLDSFRNNVVKKKVNKNFVCREPFYGFTIHNNGNVVPCDRDWKGENVMGNLWHEKPLEIWNGEKYQAFRAAIKSEKKPGICRNCPEGRLFNARSQPHIQVNQFKGGWVE